MTSTAYKSDSEKSHTPHKSACSSITSFLGGLLSLPGKILHFVWNNKLLCLMVGSAVLDTATAASAYKTTDPVCVDLSGTRLPCFDKDGWRHSPEYFQRDDLPVDQFSQRDICEGRIHAYIGDSVSFWRYSESKQCCASDRDSIHLFKQQCDKHDSPPMIKNYHIDIMQGSNVVLTKNEIFADDHIHSEYNP